jgi:glycosyltransferase involved in cell wall biosynthesis
MTRIDIVVVGGSPYGVNPEEVEWPGLGGAELALINFARTMGKRGYEVNVYNNPRKNGDYGSVRYWNIDDFRKDEPERDVLICFRGPVFELSAGAQAKKKIGFSCDQFTMGDYDAWYRAMDEMVVISQFHKNDHLRRYGSVAEKAIPIDLGVLVEEYPVTEKIPYQCIFCSVPDRGLGKLAALWPRIIEQVPEATLVVTSSYGLWNNGQDEGNFQYRLQLAGMKGLRFLGRIPRSELVKRQLESEVHLYPCTYDENFCIAVAETQVAGAFPVTSINGALGTTNFTGMQIEYDVNSNVFDDTFVRATVTFLKKPAAERNFLQQAGRNAARKRFDWEIVADQWEKIING